jgi:hypothetical protein
MARCFLLLFDVFVHWKLFQLLWIRP